MALPVPSPFKFGYHYDEKNDKADKKTVLAYPGERHILLFGVNGAGKSTRILIENLVTLKNRSFVIIDLKGELAAQTARARRRFGDVKIIDPFGVLPDFGVPIESDGYNPLALLNPDTDEFVDQAKQLTLAMIENEGGGENQFFTQAARDWFCAGIMWEVVQAKKQNRPASLLRAREWCLQPEESETLPDGRKVQIKGYNRNAKRAVRDGGRQIANLAMPLAVDTIGRTEKSITQTLAAETGFLISPAMERDLVKSGWSFAQLKQRPTAVYIVVPPDQLDDKRRWLRMLITAALNELLHTGPYKTLFILDEFRVSIGHLPIVNNFWSLVRGYGVQFMPVCQSITQLKYLFKEEWPNYAGQAGAVATIGPPGDTETAKWMSERSGNTTMWQEGQSEGESLNPRQGPGTNTGKSRSPVARALKLQQEIMSMRPGSGMIWLAGEGEKVYPYFAPNFWQRPEIKALVDPNPYITGRVRSSRAARPASAAGAVIRGRGLEVVFALLFLAAGITGMLKVFDYIHQFSH